MTELAIIKLLLDDADVSAIVGDKVSLSYIPQNEQPPMLLLFLPNANKSGTKDDIKINDVDIEIVSVCPTIEDCLNLDRKVHEVLQHYSGTVTLENTEQVRINHAYQSTTKSEFNEQLAMHTIITKFNIKSVLL